MKLNNVTYNVHSTLKGKTLRIKRNGESYTGILLGLGDSIMATGPTTTIHPWRLQTSDGKQYDFLPEAWEIHDESSAGFTDKI